MHLARLLALLLLGGCATVVTYEDEPPEYLVKKDTDLFRSGPAQAHPPADLAAGTTVWVLRKDSGYALVEFADESTGYVELADLRPAPPVAPGVPFDPVLVEEIVEVPLPDFDLVPGELPDAIP
jgi:hypothetical protein